MKHSIILLILFNATFSIAQSNFTQFAVLDSLPPDTLLYQSLATYHQNLLTAQLEEYELSRTKPWLNYIPSVGLGYNLQGEPRPTVSLSISQVLNAKKQQADLMAKRRSIVLTATLFHQSERRQLTNLIRQYQLQVEELQFAYTIHEIDIRLVEFYETQHQNHEMNASSFLLKQRDFLLKQQALIRMKNVLEEKRLIIFEIAKHNLYTSSG